WECRASASRFAPVNRGRVVPARLGLLPFTIAEAAEEAALVPFVTDSRSQRFHLHENRILIAIREDLFHHEAVSGAFALEPEFVARAAEEGRISGLHRAPECLLIHEAEHEHAAACRVLNDGGNEPAEFVEIE